jgi:hypothetical protein
MRKGSQKKLSLSRQTLSRLTDLSAVRGGVRRIESKMCTRDLASLCPCTATCQCD